MAVNLNPEVGRILLLRGRSTEIFPWYEKGGKIIRMSGKRAYFINEKGKETFTHEFSAVVDTPDEEAQLLAFTAIAKKRRDALIASMHEDAKALEAVLNAKGGELKSIATRVRRVR